MREQFITVDAAIAHCALLGDRVDAVCRSDERGALGGDEAALHRATGFHEFGGKHDVHVARQRHQRENGLAAVALGL